MSQGTRDAKTCETVPMEEDGMQYNETTLDSRFCSCLLALHSGLRLPDIIYSLVVTYTKIQQKIPITSVVNKSIIVSSIAVPAISAQFFPPPPSSPSFSFSFTNSSRAPSPSLSCPPSCCPIGSS